MSNFEQTIPSSKCLSSCEVKAGEGISTVEQPFIGSKGLVLPRTWGEQERIERMDGWTCMGPSLLAEGAGYHRRWRVCFLLIDVFIDGMTGIECEVR